MTILLEQWLGLPSAVMVDVTIEFVRYVLQHRPLLVGDRLDALAA